MTRICQLDCTRPASKSAVIAGTYYSRLCATHFNAMVASQAPSSGHASYNQQRDLEDHQADVIQPRLGGRINPEFVRQYPEKAKLMFTEAEMDDATRRE